MSLKRILVLLVIGALLVLPIASADDSGPIAHNSENDLRFTDYPQVYVNISNNASFNVSYVGLLLFTSSGAYFSYFPNERWTVDRISNNSLSYNSAIHFNRMDDAHLGLIANKFNITNLPTAQNVQSDAISADSGPINANITILMNKSYVPNPVLNGSPGKNLTGFQITFSLYSSQITGKGDLLLIQQLGAKLQNGYEQYHKLKQMSANLTSVNDSAVGVTSTNYDAYFWWNSSYILNGHSANLSAVKSVEGNIDTVVFKYEFSNGLQSIVQDPYFSIPQINLFNNPILQKDILNATHYIVIHLELFVAGLVTGGLLLGVSYGSYRRRRF